MGHTAAPMDLSPGPRAGLQPHQHALRPRQQGGLGSLFYLSKVHRTQTPKPCGKQPKMHLYFRGAVPSVKYHENR